MFENRLNKAEKAQKKEMGESSQIRVIPFRGGFRILIIDDNSDCPTCLRLSVQHLTILCRCKRDTYIHVCMCFGDKKATLSA